MVKIETGMGNLRYVALDLECATSDIGNICEIGLVVMNGSEEIAHFRSLIRPVVESFGDWQRWNFSYSLNDTLDSPTFPEIWNHIQPMIEGLPVVAHNASMVECKHLASAFVHHEMQDSAIPVMYCTLELARKGWPDIEKHGIKFVAKHFEWALDHHNPESDARVCAAIVNRLSTEKGIQDWGKLVDEMQWNPHTIQLKGVHGLQKKAVKPKKKEGKNYSDDLVVWSPTGELGALAKGQRFIMSGFSLDKKKKLKRVAKSFGLINSRFMSASLHFLVADERMGAAKYKRCQDQAIPIISENEFRERLEQLPRVDPAENQFGRTQ
ncbi:MAG: exonuclease domain-containing protein [Flavobacteriales bacterium]|nr:exonuclease domain-containing protein [Flavobacteriales bacterium]